MGEGSGGMIDILALDVATVCGFARGKVGEIPTSGSIRFDGGATRPTDNQVFGAALNWIVALFEQGPLPDVLIMEALLPPTAMKGETTTAVRDRLGGLHGIARGVAHRYGVGEISTVSVGAVRSHFIGDRSLRREAAKREVLYKCQALGWPAANFDAADACAVWHYACCLIDPKLALQVSPLFRRKVAG
jgi:crossover junction endodeoxyribonuclease RuvC